jgi:hypothetical protein
MHSCYNKYQLQFYKNDKNAIQKLKIEISELTLF